MSSFIKLFQSILDSTVWELPDRVRIVWITLLAMADQDGIVSASIPGLARRALVSVEDVHQALDLFHSPDPYSRTKDYEGRRIETIDGGWRILNYASHRARGSEEERRAKATERQRRKRERDAQIVTHRHAPSRPVTHCHEKSRSSLQAEAEVEAETNTPLPPKGGKPGKDDFPFQGTPFDSESSREAWLEFAQHRKAKRAKPYTPQGLKRLLAKLEAEKYDSGSFVKLLSRAIMRQWQGLPEEVIEEMAPRSDLVECCEEEWGAFLEAYPRPTSGRPIDKAVGRVRFDALARSGEDIGAIVQGAKRYASWCREFDKGEFVKSIPSWLAGRMWEESYGADPIVQAESKPQQGKDFYYRAMQIDDEERMVRFAIVGGVKTEDQFDEGAWRAQILEGI